MTQTGWLSAVLYLLASVQNIGVISAGGVAVKLFHIAVAFLLLAAILDGHIPPSLRPARLYLYLVLVVSPLGYAVYGFNTLYFNYIFCLIIVFAVGAVFVRREYAEALSGVKFAAFAIAAYALLNVLVNYASVAQAQAPSVITGARPQIPNMVYSGGLNIEGTWIALAAAFFLRDRKLFWVYAAMSIFIQASYMSRAGFIIAVFVVLARSFFLSSTRRGRALMVVAVVGSLPLLMALGMYLADHVPVLKRIVEIGNEPGSVARLDMWRVVADAFWDSPWFGYGAGNDILAVQRHGIMVASDNIHNLYLSNLLALGLVGAPALVFLLWRLARLSWGKVEFVAYIAGFAVVAMVELRGADTVMYCVVAILAAAAQQHAATTGEGAAEDVAQHQLPPTAGTRPSR